MPRPLELSLSAPVVDAPPGGEAELALTVRNVTADAREVDLHLDGAAADWGRLEKRRVTVEPGGAARVRMKVRPPDTPEVQAGPVGYTITAATEGQDPDGPQEIAGTVDVGVHQDWDIRLDPAELVTGGEARTRLRILNRGNVLLYLTAVPPERDAEVRFSLGDGIVTVQPGAETSIPVKVWPSHRSWTQAVPPRGFEVVMEGGGGLRRLAHGTLRQRAAIWTVGVRGALLAVVLLAATVGLASVGSKALAARRSTTQATDAKGLPIASGPTLPPLPPPVTGPDGVPVTGPSTPAGAAGPPRLLRRFYQPRNGDFIYTTDPTQGASLIQEGYQAQSDAGSVLTDPAPGTVPLYRVARPDGGHIFTSDQGERQTLLARKGYSDEGIAGHLYPAPVPGSVPLYVMKKGETYLLTRDEEELRQRAPGGWTNLGIRGYVLR